MNSISKTTKVKSKRKTKTKKTVKTSKNLMNPLNSDSHNCDIICETNEFKDSVVCETKPKERQKNRSDNHLITEYYPTLSLTRKRLTAKAKEMERDQRIKDYLNKKCDPTGILAVEEFDGKGKGVVATTTIPKGEFICEYSGDLVDIQKAKSKEVSYAMVGAGCYMYYFQWKSKVWCVDATQPNGRFGRLINHSRKSPNCKTKLIETNGRPHLVFIALRDIKQNEEILYDYGETDKTAIKEHPWLTST